MILRCGRFALQLDRPVIMGVLNVTPDSFSDGGRFMGPEAAIEHARGMVEDGAAIIDVGGESTRPGAQPVSEKEELARILPVLEGLAGLPVPVSVDTRRPRVMREVLAAGASMINDIEALCAPGAIEAVAASSCALCLMHMRGEPETMQREPRYDDVVREVMDALAQRLDAAQGAGIARERLVADVGFGFGKTDRHNLALLRRLPEFLALGVPLLAGLSRKSTLGRITGRAPQDRLAASLAAALLAAQGGARILRVHDVGPTRDVLEVWQALSSGEA